MCTGWEVGRCMGGVCVGEMCRYSIIYNVYIYNRMQYKVTTLSVTPKKGQFARLKLYTGIPYLPYTQGHPHTSHTTTHIIPPTHPHKHIPHAANKCPQYNHHHSHPEHCPHPLLPTRTHHYTHIYTHTHIHTHPHTSTLTHSHRAPPPMRLHWWKGPANWDLNS